MTYANTFPTGAKKPTSEELRHRFDGRRDKAWYVGMLWAIVAIVYGSIMFDVSLGLNLCFLIFLYISASWPHSFLAINYIRWRHRSAQCENPKWSKWSMNEATFGYMLDIAWPFQPCEPLHCLTSLPLHDTPSPISPYCGCYVSCVICQQILDRCEDPFGFEAVHALWFRQRPCKKLSFGFPWLRMMKMSTAMAVDSNLSSEDRCHPDEQHMSTPFFITFQLRPFPNFSTFFWHFRVSLRFFKLCKRA